jgi:hypothetical protein
VDVNDRERERWSSGASNSHAHAAASQADTVRRYEKWADEDRAAGRLKDAAHWEASAAKERNVRLPNAPESES